MREGSGPCRKQAILSSGTLNDGCESNQVIVSCNLAVIIICSVANSTLEEHAAAEKTATKGTYSNESVNPTVLLLITDEKCALFFELNG